MTDKSVNTLTGKALGLAAEDRLEVAAEPIKMDSAVMLNAMANLLNDDTDGTLLGDLSEWMAERYGGEVVKPDSGGVYIQPADEWMDAFDSRELELNTTLSDWSVIHGNEEPGSMMERFRLTLQEASDGLWFAFRSERVAEINDACNDSIPAIGLYGKFEVANGFPRIAVSKVEDDTTLILSSGHKEGVFIGLDKDSDTIIKAEPGTEAFKRSYKTGFIVPDGGPLDETLEQGRVANFAWTLHHSPLFDVEISDFGALLNHVQLNAQESSANNDTYRVVIPTDMVGAADRVYEAVFHPLQVSIKEIKEVKPSLDPTITIKTKPTA